MSENAFNRERLKIARKLKMLESKELAKEIGISRVHMTRLEKGSCQPEKKTIQNLSSALGVEQEFFFLPIKHHLNGLNFLYDFRYTKASERERVISLAILNLNDHPIDSSLKINHIFCDTPRICSFKYEDKYYILLNENASSFDIAVQVGHIVKGTKNKDEAAIYACSKLIKEEEIRNKLGIDDIERLSSEKGIPIYAILLFIRTHTKIKMLGSRYYYLRRYFLLKGTLQVGA